MPPPDELQEKMHYLLSTVPRHALAAASEQLTKRYRSEKRDQENSFMTDIAHRLAYLAVRMPATYAVVERVLEEIRLRFPPFAPTTLTDYGSGPGTATWAASESFPDLKTAILFEADQNLLTLGKQLMQNSSTPALASATWHTQDLLQLDKFPITDLSILSYVVGELPIELLPPLISKIWESTSQVLVIIEPGTPHGFERIRLLRDHLISLNAHLVAPCPHQNQCPMTGSDWCHFSQRLERSETHRLIKEVSLGYEDEKYSYIVASKSPVTLPSARILRHPNIHSGHVDLTLCTPTGLEKTIISRRQGPLYKLARKSDWGDAL